MRKTKDRIMFEFDLLCSKVQEQKSDYACLKLRQFVSSAIDGIAEDIEQDFNKAEDNYDGQGDAFVYIRKELFR